MSPAAAAPAPHHIQPPQRSASRPSAADAAGPAPVPATRSSSRSPRPNDPPDTSSQPATTSTTTTSTTQSTSPSRRPTYTRVAAATRSARSPARPSPSSSSSSASSPSPNRSLRSNNRSTSPSHLLPTRRPTRVRFDDTAVSVINDVPPDSPSLQIPHPENNVESQLQIPSDNTVQTENKRQRQRHQQQQQTPAVHGILKNAGSNPPGAVNHAALSSTWDSDSGSEYFDSSDDDGHRSRIPRSTTANPPTTTNSTLLASKVAGRHGGRSPLATNHSPSDQDNSFDNSSNNSNVIDDNNNDNVDQDESFVTRAQQAESPSFFASSDETVGSSTDGHSHRRGSEATASVLSGTSSNNQQHRQRRSQQGTVLEEEPSTTFPRGTNNQTQSFGKDNTDASYDAEHDEVSHNSALSPGSDVLDNYFTVARQGSSSAPGGNTGDPTTVHDWRLSNVSSGRSSETDFSPGYYYADQDSTTTATGLSQETSKTVTPAVVISKGGQSKQQDGKQQQQKARQTSTTRNERADTQITTVNNLDDDAGKYERLNPENMSKEELGAIIQSLDIYVRRSGDHISVINNASNGAVNAKIDALSPSNDGNNSKTSTEKAIYTEETNDNGIVSSIPAPQMVKTSSLTSSQKQHQLTKDQVPNNNEGNNKGHGTASKNAALMVKTNKNNAQSNTNIGGAATVSVNDKELANKNTTTIDGHNSRPLPNDPQLSTIAANIVPTAPDAAAQMEALREKSKALLADPTLTRKISAVKRSSAAASPDTSLLSPMPIILPSNYSHQQQLSLAQQAMQQQQQQQQQGSTSGKSALMINRELNKKKITVAVYIDEYKSMRSIKITTAMTSDKIVACIVKAFQLAPDPSFCLFEVCEDTELERPIRDWEFVSDLIDNWDKAAVRNHIGIRKFPYRDSVSPLVIVGKFPTMQGYLHYEYRPGKWQRRFFVLKGDNLYHYNNKENMQQETLFCSLATLDAYYALGKRKKMATNYFFALRYQNCMTMYESKDDYVKYLCTDQPEHINDWIMALRLTKSEMMFVQQPEAFDAYDHMPIKDRLRQRANQQPTTTTSTTSGSNNENPRLVDSEPLVNLKSVTSTPIEMVERKLQQIKMQQHQTFDQEEEVPLGTSRQGSSMGGGSQQCTPMMSKQSSSSSQQGSKVPMMKPLLQFDNDPKVAPGSIAAQAAAASSSSGNGKSLSKHVLTSNLAATAGTRIPSGINRQGEIDATSASIEDDDDDDTPLALASPIASPLRTPLNSGLPNGTRPLVDVSDSVNCRKCGCSEPRRTNLTGKCANCHHVHKG